MAISNSTGLAAPFIVQRGMEPASFQE